MIKCAVADKTVARQSTDMLKKGGLKTVATDACSMKIPAMKCRIEEYWQNQ